MIKWLLSLFKKEQPSAPVASPSPWPFPVEQEVKKPVKKAVGRPRKAAVKKPAVVAKTVAKKKSKPKAK
jgi:hypothetical protein